MLVQVLCKDSEGTKHGSNQDEAMELVSFIKTECQMLRFRGLMSMGAVGDTEEFASVYNLKKKILSSYADLSEDEFMLSMGTSADFEQAVLHGST